MLRSVLAGAGQHTQGCSLCGCWCIPSSIPGTVKRNALVYSANRASAIRIVVQWQISKAYSCLLGCGGVWELCLTINYQRKYPGWGSLTQLLTTLSNTWQNGNFLVIARVSYFLILWFHQYLKLCWELHSDCKEPGYLSAALVSSLPEVADAFQVIHWSYRTVFDSLGTRRQRKPRRNINSFTNLISLLAFKKIIYYTIYIYIFKLKK